MAYHFELPGHTAVVINAVYTRSLIYRRYYRCRLFNESTGLCVLTPIEDTNGSKLFLSSTNLSHWYRIFGFDEFHK